MTRVAREGAETDDVAVEAPLEIRVAGEPLAVTMRTPGDDRALALGFLLAEGVIEGVEDVGTLAHCGRVGEEGYGDTLEVTPAPGVVLAIPEEGRRGTLTTAACGVCGRRSIDDLLARIRPVEAHPIDEALLREAPDRLRALQPYFERTGGVHGAALFDPRGGVIAHAEDVGRHNAVDKSVGRALLDARLADARLLAVSGRVSFEIVQKAAAAGVSAISAVGAPTTLAVDLAVGAGVVLAAFTRGGGTNVYAGAERVRRAPGAG